MAKKKEAPAFALVSEQDGITTPPKSKRYINMPWYVPTPELRRMLKQLALNEDTSVSKLITEGIGYVLEKRGISIDDYL